MLYYYLFILIVLLGIAVYKFYIEPNTPEEKKRREKAKQKEEENKLIEKYIYENERPREVDEIINKRVKELEDDINNKFNSYEKNIRDQISEVAYTLLEENITNEYKERKVYNLFELIHRDYKMIGIIAVENILNTYIMNEMHEKENAIDWKRYSELSSFIDNIKEQFN